MIRSTSTSVLSQRSWRDLGALFAHQFDRIDDGLRPQLDVGFRSGGQVIDVRRQRSRILNGSLATRLRGCVTVSRISQVIHVSGDCSTNLARLEIEVGPNSRLDHQNRLARIGLFARAENVVDAISNQVACGPFAGCRCLLRPASDDARSSGAVENDVGLFDGFSLFSSRSSKRKGCVVRLASRANSS